MAVAVRARLRSENRNDYDSSDSLDLIPDDRTVLVVDRRPDQREFVLVGEAPGNTCLRVIIDHHQVDCIDAAVTAQSGLNHASASRSCWRWRASTAPP